MDSPERKAPLAPMASPGLAPLKWDSEQDEEEFMQGVNAPLLKDKLNITLSGERYEVKKVEDKLSFDKGLFLTLRAVQVLRKLQAGKTIVVGISGASGSGKTHFASRFCDLIPGTKVLGLDNYMLRERVVEDNFDDPNLLEFPLLKRNLEDLKAGRSTECPVYSFAESKRTGYTSVEVPQSKVVIVEGTYASKAILRPLYDVIVSVTGGVHYDLVKRVIRDVHRVGQNPKEVINQITDTVYPMYKAFIEPDMAHAHFHVHNYFNPFEGFVDPIYILKSNKVLSKESIRKVMGDQVSEREETYTDVFLYPPSSNPDDCHDWIRYRDHGSQYQLMFSEWLREGNFIICPRISFEVNVRVLGGLMSLGYRIGFIVERHSQIFQLDNITVTIDSFKDIPNSYIQIKGSARKSVEDMGSLLGLKGSYDPQSYIELIKTQVQQPFSPRALQSGHGLPSKQSKNECPCTSVASRSRSTGHREQDPQGRLGQR